MTTPLQPRTIALETPHYVVRTIEPADATEGWRNWLSDAATARMLNAKPAQLTPEALRNYIAGFDRKTSHLLGIFEKETGNLVGIRAVYIEPSRREFLVNVLIGEIGARHKGARSETREVMYRYFFEDMDLLTARCIVLAGNEPILKVMRDNGWIRDRSETRPAASGGGKVELYHFHLPRDVWRRTESEA